MDLIVVFIGGPIYFWRRQSQRAAPRPRHAPHCALCRREGPVSNGRRGREKIGPPTSVCLSVRPLSVRRSGQISGRRCRSSGSGPSFGLSAATSPKAKQGSHAWQGDGTTCMRGGVTLLVSLGLGRFNIYLVRVLYLLFIGSFIVSYLKLIRVS